MSSSTRHMHECVESIFYVKHKYLLTTSLASKLVFCKKGIPSKQSICVSPKHSIW